MLELENMVRANFSAGPASLPDYVNDKLMSLFAGRCKSEYSLLEVSHRSRDFDLLREKLVGGIRRVLNVPDNYSVLFLPGGGRGQNAAVPMNLMPYKNKAVYLNTGFWSKAASIEAAKYGEVILEDPASLFARVDAASYYYYTDNETISGRYCNLPHSFNHKRVVCDMSSSLFAYLPDFNKIGLVFAATQKHLGLPGAALVIVDNDWLELVDSMPITPDIFDYKKQISKQSLLNTPCNITWLTASYMLDWIGLEGGLASVQLSLSARSDVFYKFFDKSKFYRALVAVGMRSKCNIVFATKSVKLDRLCIDFLAKRGVLGVRGHSSNGFLRISLYIGSKQAHVDYLLNSLADFEVLHG